MESFIYLSEELGSVRRIRKPSLWLSCHAQLLTTVVIETNSQVYVLILLKGRLGGSQHMWNVYSQSTANPKPRETACQQHLELLFLPSLELELFLFEGVQSWGGNTMLCKPHGSFTFCVPGNLFPVSPWTALHRSIVPRQTWEGGDGRKPHCLAPCLWIRKMFSFYSLFRDN